jgi:Predicted nucleic acid-binding protein, contains PIN domain
MKQSSIVFDAFAILSFLKGEPSSNRVKEYLLKVNSKQAHGYISAVNLCEVYYIVMREKGYEDAEILTTSLRDWGLNVVLADEDMAKMAGQLKSQYPLSLADAFAAATSQKLEACLLTGDPEFQKLEGKVEIEWVVR